MREPRQSKGFSLIEVLFALTILSIAVVALGSVMLSTFRAQDNITKGAIARAMAARILERSINELPKLTAEKEAEFWSDDYSASSWRSGEEKVGTMTYRYEVTATLLNNLDTGMGIGSASGATGNGLKHMIVVVYWSSELGAGGVQRGTQKVVVSRFVNRVKR